MATDTATATGRLQADNRQICTMRTSAPTKRLRSEPLYVLVEKKASRRMEGDAFGRGCRGSHSASGRATSHSSAFSSMQPGRRVRNRVIGFPARAFLAHRPAASGPEIYPANVLPTE